MTETNKQRALDILIKVKPYNFIETNGANQQESKEAEEILEMIKSQNDVNELSIFLLTNDVVLSIETIGKTTLLRVFKYSLGDQFCCKPYTPSKLFDLMKYSWRDCEARIRKATPINLLTPLKFPKLKRGDGLTGKFVFDIEEYSDDQYTVFCGEETTDGCLDDRGLGNGDRVIEELFKDYTMQIQDAENAHTVTPKEGETFDQFKKEATKRLKKAGAIKMN